MTPRDLRWRIGGAALSIGAVSASLLDGDRSPLTILYFLAALAGLILTINGKRVAVVWKAERRQHGRIASAVRSGWSRGARRRPG